MEELDWEVLKNCHRIKGNEDRVRICDTKSVTSESVYSKASSQKSGWRQKSYSSIDLSTNSDHQPGAGAFRYRDFETQDDSCLKNSKNNKNKETQRDYEDIYNINPKAQGLKGEIIKEHNKINHDKRDNEVCSLRRTKSLAVIREETFNDLNIAAPTTRRSQLIPRAKLIDRHFFKDRLSFTLDEGLSFSLDSNLTSESTKNSSSNNNSNFFSWNCDKSDLGSIDSNFFKNSLHQSALLAAEKSSTLQTESTSISTVTSKIVSRAEIHNENNGNNNNNNNNNDSGNSSNSGTTRLNPKKSENNNEIESTVNINEDTESGITIIEIKDRKQLSKPASSVISYDSIYLSSESDKQTVLGDTISNLEDIDSKIKDFEKIIRELNLIGDSEKSDSIIDNLYSQVAKGGVISTTELDLPTIFNQPKINLDASSADYISKGTLERLAILSGLTLNGNNLTFEKDFKKKNKGSRDSKGFQYSSLPDVDISKLLRDCELIDANLRDDVSIELLEPYPDYDLNSAEQNIPSISSSPSSDTIDRNKANNQKDTVSKSEISVNLNEPTSLEDENPKGAPSIELVLLSTKELSGKIKEDRTVDEKAHENTTKIYLPDLGLELDYENSIASFEEDESEEDYIAVVPQKVKHHTYQPPTYNLVTISGRKVIVDELAAKTEQQKENYNNRGEATFKEKKHTETTTNGNKRKEGGRSNSSSSSSPSLLSANISSNKTTKKAIVGKINGVDKRETNIDKKAAKKIKLPECKQSFADSIIDKEILFRKNSNFREVEEVAIQLTYEKGDGNAINDKKDFTSFCILQQKNTGGVKSSSNSNMPRPQLLNVIDSKNSAPKQNQQLQQKQRSNKVPDVRIVMTTDVEEKPLPLNEAEKEFLHKVDSVRNYWSKILDSDGSKFKTLSKAFSTSKSSNDIPSSLRNEDFQSFFPTVEIVELNGETQAALVTARKLNDEEFDHVRYKVMKSEMFQKNLERNNSNRKETQFDGLMQYLQDYSFQELLASNNVVIIEPVRTKIEKVSEKPNQAQSGPCKITNGAALLNRSGSNNLKKHFFYHPIRVNKELYEDELPVPDTVRNVRKLFEESLRMKKFSENCKNLNSSDNMKQRKTIRYLTIDTSFDNNLATSKWDSISLSSGVSSAADLSSPCECHESTNRNISNNSSNGNLDNNGNNVVDEKSHFVGSDVLEKLRECGSSITYNGGNGSERKSISCHDNEKHISEQMTKATVKEGQKCNCQGRQTRGLSLTNENGECGAEKVATTKKINGSDYTGLKFKLVKSNSCSSRLELAGTGLEKNLDILNVVDEMRDIVHGQRRQLHEEQEDERENDVKLGENLEHEETVKDMIHKLETKNFSAPTKPRIIESRCIEKVHPTSSASTAKEKDPYKVTINNQASSFIAPSMLSNIDPKNDYEEYVTVNNHISISSKTSEQNNPTILMMHENGGSNISSNSSSCENVSKIQSSSTTKPKVVRNKNVDLALLAAVNKKKEIEKNPKGFNSRDIENIFVQNDNHNEHENSKAFIKTSRNDACKMQSVDMVKHQDKLNSSSNHTKSHQQQLNSQTSDAHFVASSEKIVASSSLSSSNKMEEKPVKMVNWGTVGIFCKEFVANDNRLVQQQVKIYDDMEFEEFEVAGEHYDSLNSK